MTPSTVSANRVTIGLLALGCLIGAIALIPFAPESSSLVLWQGGLARGGLLLGALWLAMPSRNRDAAWAQLSPKTLGILAVLLLLSTRIRLQFLIPAAAVVGVVLLILRPKPKYRPPAR